MSFNNLRVYNNDVVVGEYGYGFTPRWYQIPVFKIFDEGCNRIMKMWHRRSGKDLSDWNLMIRQSLLVKGNYFYIFAQKEQGRNIIWEGFDTTGERKRRMDYFPPGSIKHLDNQNLRVTLVNGSTIQICGGSQVEKSVVGSTPRGVVFSDYSLHKEGLWQYMEPAIEEAEGWVIFNLTPRLEPRYRHGYKMFLEKSKPDADEWFCSRLGILETGAVSEDYINKKRAEGVSESKIQSEYYVRLVADTDGTYYSKFIMAMRNRGGLCSLRYDASRPVHTAWDIGISDYTAIIFFQVFGSKIHVIDYIKERDNGLIYYLNRLLELPYASNYGVHLAPHDIVQRDKGSGEQLTQMARRHHVNFTVLEKGSLQAGIEKVRQTFPRIVIDSFNCDELITDLESYRRAKFRNMDGYSDKPEKSDANHGSDAFRYMCVGLPHVYFYISNTDGMGRILGNSQYDIHKDYTFGNGGNRIISGIDDYLL